MLAANMLFLTRSIALRVRLATFRSATSVTIPRALLPTGFSTYRGLSTTPSLFTAAAAKTKPAAAKTTGGSKPEAKGKVKSQAKAKEKPKPTANKRKVAAKPKVSTRVPLVLRPPKKSPTAFILFFNRVFPSPSSNPGGITSASKEAGVAWHKLSDLEKKPYVDEVKLLNEKYIAERDKWYKDPNNSKVLRTLNKDRKKRGKSRIHAPRSDAEKKPMPPFIRFSQELRLANIVSPAQAPTGITTPRAIWAARESAVKWNALSASEKEKYFKAYRDELTIWRQSSTAARA